MKVNLRQRADRRGTACVEAAVIIPVLLMLIFGFIEVGYLINSHQILHDAARQGARAAVLHKNSNTQVAAAVKNSLNHSIGSSASVVQVHLHKLNQAGGVDYQVTSLDENENGHAVKISVSVPYSAFRPPSNFLGLSSTINSAAVMQRHE